jgi:hypothetical protein
MPRYPEILLPKKNYPLLTNAMVNDYTLVRETLTDLYVFLARQSYEPDDILRFVVAPQPSLREVFELSVFLYGYGKIYFGVHCCGSGVFQNRRKAFSSFGF